MIRRAVVRPRPGDATVTRQDVMQALEDAEAVLWMSGGGLRVVTVRVMANELLADGMPGEAFTQAVVVEWSDRTDARAVPERTVPAQEQADGPGGQADLADALAEPDDAPAADEDVSAVPSAL